MRNDQAGVVARSIDDIIAFDQAVLGNAAAHAAAKAAVDAMSNSQIRIGCSTVYYDEAAMSPGIAETYARAKGALVAAGFTFVGSCHTTNPSVSVPDLATGATMPHYSAWFGSLQEYLHTTLGEPGLDPWGVMLNGVYDFGTSLSQGWLYGHRQEGCALLNSDTPALRAEYLGRIPAERADVHNAYFDSSSSKGWAGVDLIMGPTQICETITWTDDIEGGFIKGKGCDKGRFAGNCLYNCLSRAVTGDFDKTFTKAKFVVPAGLVASSEKASGGEPFSLHFMSRAGPRNPTVPAAEWVKDEAGPANWNLEELYIVQRIAGALASAGFGRAEAPLNAISGLSGLGEGSGEVPG